MSFISARYMRLLAALCLFLNGTILTAASHDFWIEPSGFKPAPGTLIDVRLLIGNPFAGEPVLRDSNKISKFFILNSKEEKSVLGFEGKDPAGYLRLTEPGLHIIGYQSSGEKSVLEAGEFEKYLKQYGLENIRAMRSRQNERQKPGREIFSRCAKSLIFLSGENPQSAAFDRHIGLSLEMIPGKNPYLLHPGEQLPVRLLYNEEPVEGAQIVLSLRGHPEKTKRIRSAKDGMVVLDLPQKGDWLVTVVHMVPAADGINADWESFWGSLSFMISDPDEILKESNP